MAGAALAMMLVGAFLVGGAAIWLLLVSTLLDQISTRLDIIVGATSGIDAQLQPAAGVVGGIAGDVGAIQSALHALISQVPPVGAVAHPLALGRPAPEPDYVFAWAKDHPDYEGAQARARAARTDF